MRTDPNRIIHLFKDDRSTTLCGATPTVINDPVGQNKLVYQCQACFDIMRRSWP